MPKYQSAPARGTEIYSKPALPEHEFLDRWVERGLVLGDRERAARYLRHIGYYRLSAYVRSFEAGTRDQMRPGTSFDDVLGLYIFDRKLRLTVLDPLERVEIAVRAAICDRMSLTAGPHWYEDPERFRVPRVHERLLNDIDRLVGEQRRRPHEPTDRETFVSALEHYVTRYGTPERPPCWPAFEEVNLGTVRNVYAALADPAAKNAIAESLGTRAPILESWLLTYRRVRNICAHHGRLWNRGLGVYPATPRSSAIRWLDDRSLFHRDGWRRRRLFPVLVSLQTMLHTIAPTSRWALRVEDLLREHPTVPLAGMGIPDDWLSDPFWPSASP